MEFVSTSGEGTRRARERYAPAPLPQCSVCYRRISEEDRELFLHTQMCPRCAHQALKRV